MTDHMIDLTMRVRSGPGSVQTVHLDRIGVPCDVPTPTIESFTTGELVEELARRLREEPCYGET